MHSEYTPIEIARFWAKVDRAGDCWLWNGARNVAGYGHLFIHGRWMLAHRLAKELADGQPVPAECFVLHRCDTPPCVRPRHLLIGDHHRNMEMMVAAGHSTPGDRHPLRVRPERAARGERVGSAKLTAPEVRAIRERYTAGGITLQALADEYSVARSSIYRTVHSQRWAHVK